MTARPPLPPLHPPAALFPSSGRPDHPRASPSLGAPAAATAGGSRRGAVTPAAPAATVPGSLLGPLFILAREQPVAWDPATQRWWGRSHEPHGARVGFDDATAIELIRRGLARRDGDRLCPAQGETPHAP